jgi:hypothetical protein
MDELMNSDYETMFAALMEEEAEITVRDDEEHLMLLSCLIVLYARSDAKPRRGESASGRRKSKPRQRLEGYCILYADYFADDPLHGEVVFRRHFWMSRKLFLDIVDAQRTQRLVLFLLFKFYLFGFKLLFVCMNNNFNNLYESSGCISCRSHRRYFWQHRRSGGNAFFLKNGPNLQ